MVLCYSRQLYVEFTVSQTMEHFLACHQNAFAAFGGAPTRIMVDNLKSAVLKHGIGEAPVFNPRYLDFARYHGFGISACGVTKGNENATAVDAINTLAAAQAASKLKAELKKYLSPQILILDELGYLPTDKQGADLLFQVISQRYERGSTIITSNKASKNWPEIFNNDSTLTSALLDRLLHHAETQVIEGKSYRMKDQIEA